MKIDYEKLDRISITEIARRLGIVQKGNNWHCPNKLGHTHGDQNASLAIYEDSGSFTCFGCGAGGKRVDLVKLALNKDTETSEAWLNDHYDISSEVKEVNPNKKFPCRHIMSNEELETRGLQRFFHYSYNDLQPRMATDNDLYNIKIAIRKSYTLEALNTAHVMISDARRCLVFPGEKVSYNIKCVKPCNKYLVIEGRTDYLTALSMGLNQFINIIARINKTSKYSIPNDADEVIFLLDPDDSLVATESVLTKNGVPTQNKNKGALHYCTSGLPKKCVVKSFSFNDMVKGVSLSVYGKDLSDYWFNGGLTPTLVNIMNDVLPQEDNIYADKINVETEFVFWDNKKNIDGYDLFKAIVNDGFRLMRDYYSPDDPFQLGRIYDNKIGWYDQNEIHQHVLLEMLPRLPEQLSPIISRTDIEREVYNSTRLFETKRYNIIPKYEFDLNHDDNNNFYMYLQDYYIHVTKDKVEKLPYSELKKPIFERSIKKKVKIDILKQSDYMGCEWDMFLRHTCTPSRGLEVDGERYLALKRTIGYLLLKYKSPTLSKAVILSEDNIDDNPSGRTGKGLIASSLNYVIDMKLINGKTFRSDDRFAFQDVLDFHNLIYIDDVESNFKFEMLFSQLTDGFTSEAKNAGRRQRPSTLSPKMLISTNKNILPATSSSFRARAHEMELYCYYNADWTPEIEFGHLLLSDWDKAEWDRFYNFYFHCIQEFFLHGLTKYSSNTLKIKKITKLCNADGYNFINDKIQNELERNNEFVVPKIQLRTEMIDMADLSERSFSQTKLTKILQEYCNMQDLEFSSRVRNHERVACYKISNKDYFNG